MDHRLTLPEFLAVRRALRAGLRHYEIARELNLSVEIIARVHDEERYELDPVSNEDLPVDSPPPDYVASNLRRCPGCGAMVYVWPCMACEVNAMKRAAKTGELRPAGAGSGDPRSTQPAGSEDPRPSDEPEEAEPRRLTEKQRKWRRKRIVERMFGWGLERS